MSTIDFIGKNLTQFEKCGLLSLHPKNIFARHAFIGLGGTFDQAENLRQREGIVLDCQACSRDIFSKYTSIQRKKNALERLVNPDYEPDHQFTIVAKTILENKNAFKKLSLEFVKKFSETDKDIKKKNALTERFEQILRNGSPEDLSNPQLQRLWGDFSAAKGDVLRHAIIQNDFDLFTTLTSAQKDLSIEDSLENTLLVNAAYYGRLQFVEFLLDQGASLAKWCSGGKAVHNAIKRGHGPVAELLMAKEENPHLIEFFMRQKMLCHRFGLDYEISTQDGTKVWLHGFDEEYVVPEMLKSLDHYIKNGPEPAAAPKTKKLWLQARSVLAKALDNKENISEALAEEMAVFPIRYKDYTPSRGHSVGLVISKKHQLLIKCNRGGSGRDGLTLYRLPAEALEKAEPSIKMLFELRHTDEGNRHFNIQLNRDLFLSEIQHVQHKAQKGGTCTWASLKLNLRAVLYLLLLDTYAHDEALAISRDLYKEWTLYDRKMALQEAQTVWESIQQSADGQIETKLEKEGIVYTDLLAMVLRRCHGGNLHEIAVMLRGRSPALQVLFDELSQFAGPQTQSQ